MNENQIARFIVTPIAIVCTIIIAMYIMVPHLLSKNIKEGLDNAARRGRLGLTAIKLRISDRNKEIEKVDTERKKVERKHQDYAQLCQDVNAVTQEALETCQQSIDTALDLGAITIEQADLLLANIQDAYNAFIVENNNWEVTKLFGQKLNQLDSRLNNIRQPVTSSERQLITLELQAIESEFITHLRPFKANNFAGWQSYRIGDLDRMLAKFDTKKEWVQLPAGGWRTIK